jgi:sugar-specific transcriptional regulator TrmB
MHNWYKGDMPKDTSVIRDYFARLELEPELADLYLALTAYGPQTISELSRNASVERTRIYRLLDRMTDLNLCEMEVQYKRSIIKPAPIGNLQILITRREQELYDLRESFTEFEQALDNHKALATPATRVQFYKGKSGLKQMFWNETRAETERMSILYETTQIYTGKLFFERWVRRCNERNLRSRSLVGDHFLKSLEDWYDTHQNERLANWQGRYLPDSVFQITHSMNVYDDVIAYYSWKAGEIFGIEIYNQELADTQRQFFEMLWAQGTNISKAQAKPHLDDE